MSFAVVDSAVPQTLPLDGFVPAPSLTAEPPPRGESEATAIDSNPGATQLLRGGILAAGALPARRGGAAVTLPQANFPPVPALTAPQSQARPPSTVAAEVPGQATRFVLRGIAIDGNTVLDPAEIEAVTTPYLGKPVGLGDLEAIRRALTMAYVEHGYVNSGVTIPDQDASDGTVRMRAIEGTVTEIEVSGTDWYDPGYFTSRLGAAVAMPFNVRALEAEQQILLQDPLTRRLNLELLPGIEPGQARLHADVLEGSPFLLTAQIANDQSPTVGEVRGQLQGGIRNIFGYGDVLLAQYGRSSGLDDGFVSYTAPIAADDSRINLRYDVNGTLVVNPDLAPLHVTSDYTNLTVGLSRPFYRTPTTTLTLGMNIDKRSARTFLLGQPFSFTAGSQDGRTNVTALRVYQDFLDRDAEHAFAVRSTFSFGLPLLGATATPARPTGRFFDWLGQAQYVRRIFLDWEAVVRSDLQLSNDPLFPIEQFALGGIDTVRGYRQYLLVVDSAFYASGEMRIPIYKLRIPFIADAEQAGTVQVVPFYDFGRGWNINRPTPAPAEISSLGAGLRWLAGSGISLEAYYGRALRHVRAGTSLQDRGIHFRATLGFF